MIYEEFVGAVIYFDRCKYLLGGILKRGTDADV